MPFELPFPRSPQVDRAALGIIPVNGQPGWALLYEECQAGYAIRRPSGFPIPAMEIIVEGEGRLLRDGRSIPLRTGSYFGYGPKQSVAFASDDTRPLHKYFIAALQPGLWEQHPLGNVDTDGIRVVEQHDLLRGLLHELLLVGRQPGPDPEPVGTALLAGVAGLLLKAERFLATRRRQNALVAQALRHLDQHLLQTGSVAEWAAAVGVSPSHLCRTFRAEGGKSPYAELIDRKIHLACHLLATGTGNVRQVAARTGFEDPFHFSRVFRKRMGVPPSTLLPR